MTPVSWPRWVALTLALGGCTRQCGSDPAPRAQATVHRPELAGTPSPADHNTPTAAPDRPLDAAALVERALHVRLPERETDHVFPAMNTLPRRVLKRFDAERALVATLRGDTLHLMGATAPTHDPAALRALLRRAVEDWGQRSGVAATRLTLAVDRDADRTAASRVRKAALAAHTWFVVALSRDKGRVVEVTLSPPRPRR